MYDGTACIWPGCPKPTIESSSRFLCQAHVQIVIDEDRKARQKRIRRRRRPPVIAQKPTGLGYFEQRRIDAIWDSTSDQESDGPGWIYYIRIGGHYKIGWCKRLEQRLAQYPPDSQVLALHEGSRADEAALHRRFAHLTTAGREWYPLVPDITAHIKRVKAEGGTPDPALRCGPKPTEVRRPKIGRQGPSPRYWTGSRSA